MQRISANQYQTSERFYKLPKLLFESERYADMKLEVKVAYSVLKDRLELSISKGWVDENGDVYLIYSNTNLMALLGCSKSKLIRIKKELRDFGLIEEVQRSSSKDGRLANKIYLGELESNFDTTPVSKKDGGGVKKTLGGSQNETGPVSKSDTSDTEYSETNISDTKNSETNFNIGEDEEDIEPDPNPETIKPSRKIDKATKYDKDYIYQIVYERFIAEGIPQATVDYLAMGNFDQRYQYALENMRYAPNAEAVADYVFTGLSSDLQLAMRKVRE